MIDINNIVNTAIQQEINKAITNYVDAYMADVQQEHRRQIEALKVEIEQLKQQRAVSPATGEVSIDMDGKVLAKNVVQELLQDNAAIRQAVYDIAYEAGQAVLNEHAEAYDHDEYDSTVTAVNDANLDSLPDFDDFVKRDELEDAIRDAISIDDYVKEDEMSDAIEEKINDLVDVDTLVTKDDMYEAVREAVSDTLRNRTTVSIDVC